ncbi:hypothetical protein BG006_003614 [Podila minutissima]|uniref:HAUS augmin-like complex subunit 6 N-terminal domain-containing protein n=1 Tax=Podila minutissima TaxID=64525 RepID=A0A9P5SM40_9FUNG|nr:hypothetical protein BG006_003614 [Podila minutissima]
MKPLELNKHVFSRGHQSSKALEFILWFLFTRLDKSQARDRFKGCWPVLDRQDAREFRNVAFKWMEELRKDGCFSIGHNLEEPSPLESDNTTSKTQTPQRVPGGGTTDPQMRRNRTNSFSSTTSFSSAGRNVRSGLGMFIPTIRRSYLDESIGERLEQLVLVLSTYVLAQVVKQEVYASQRSKQQGSTGDKDDMALVGLAGAMPETQQEEEELFKSIDSQIAVRIVLHDQDLEKQSASRQQCEAQREDLDAKLHRLSQDATDLERDRDAFMKRLSQYAGRPKTSAEETRQLGNNWPKKMVDQWQPILSFVERRIKHNGTQYGVDPNSNRRISNGNQSDVPLALSYLLEQAGMSHSQSGRSDVDLTFVLKTWKRSLQAIGIKHSSISNTDKDLNTMDSIYEHHSRHLDSIRDSKHKLEKRLREASRRVERLQREQSILQWPYRRLLTTIPSTEATPITNKPECHIEAEAVEDAERLSRHFDASPHDASSSDGPNAIKNQVRQSARQVEQNSRPVLTDLGSRDLMDILSAPPIPIKKAPSVIHHTHLKPIIRAPQAQVAPATPASSIKRLSVLSRSVIRPPFGSSLRQHETRSAIARQSDSSPQRTITKPSPADLITSQSFNRRTSYEETCEKIIASLTFENEATVTPPRFNSSVMGPPTMPVLAKSSRPSTLQESVMASRTDMRSSTVASTVNKRPSPFLASILRSRTGSKPVVASTPHETSAPTSPPIESQPSAVISRESIPADAVSTPPRTVLPLAKSIFSSHLGSSKKRRQSSDFPQLSRPPAASDLINKGSELVIRKEMSNPFEDNEDDYMPGTPSKRRRMEVTRPLLALETKEYARDNTLNLGTTLFSPKTPDSKIVKPYRFTGLTLHDLRDPTPKPSKTHDLVFGSSLDKPLPIMFLHTPQRKKLFEKKSALEGIPSKSPGHSPPKSNPYSSNPLPTTPTKTSMFGSSIFSRFNIGSAPDPRENAVEHSPTKIQKPNSVPNRRSTDIGFSPKSPTKSGNLLRRLSLKTGESVETPSMGASITVDRLLSGNSVTLDRFSHSGQETNGARVTEQPLTTFVTPPKPRRPTATGTMITRVQEAEQRSTEATPASNASSNPASGASLSTPSPWGRPPSWKPKSPRMIDMEKKRLAERAARLAKKSGPIPLTMDSHSKQSLGSLKVSVYGKSTNMISSMSSLSSRSTVSGRSSSSVYNKSLDTLPEDNSMLEEEDENDEDDDTGRISPTAISPLKGSHLFSHSTFQPFSSMFSARSSTFARSIAQTRAPQTKTPPQSATRVAGKLPRSELNHYIVESRPVVSTAATTVSSSDPQLEQERQRILDGPMEEFRSRHGEDETVLNTALQSIFEGLSSSKQGSRKAEMPTGRGPQQLSDSQGSAVGLHFDENDGGGGLFDEGMPDGLDLNEALWENTEVFS